MAGQTKKIACLGGVYNNYIALEAVCRDARQKGIDYIYCLGDMGAFGPNPDKVFPVLREFNVACMQGNYDDSVSQGLDNCQCGYTDPDDNYFAKISYDYTLQNTSPENKKWLGELPESIRFNVAGRDILMCHGSPRRVNEFLWESTSPTHLLERFCDQNKVDIILATHTGIHWKRKLSENRLFVNVGVVGRPPNNGDTRIWYTVLTIEQNGMEIEFIPVEYDYNSLAAEMKSENLPIEFRDCVTSGWWTTCLEVLPHKERVRGKF